MAKGRGKDEGKLDLTDLYPPKYLGCSGLQAKNSSVPGPQCPKQLL